MEVKQGRLLIIDSNPTSRNSLASSLQGLGYAVSPVEDSQRALVQLQDQAFDLVLVSDQVLATDGSALLSDLQGDGTTQSVPAIAVSTADRLASVEEALQLGVEDYLIMPLRPALLKTRVDALLERRWLRQQGQEEHELLKFERDLQIARQIQRSFLPDHLPQPDGWQIAACCQPARDVAGDFYDAFYLTNKRRVGFIIGDVCDKGVAAALFMAIFRSLIRAYSQQHYSLSWMDVLSNDWLTAKPRDRHQALPTTGTTALKAAVDLTNSYILNNHMQSNIFATLFFGVFDPASGELIYVNGGHNPPVIAGPSGIKEHLMPTGPAVGMFPNVEYAIGRTNLAPGDALLCYTDGVTESRGPDGEFFTEKRLLALVEEEPATSAQAMLDRVDRAVHAHMLDADQFDDITMIAVWRQPAAETQAASAQQEEAQH